jgi:hypothetical protein
MAAPSSSASAGLPPLIACTLPAHRYRNPCCASSSAIPSAANGGNAHRAAPSPHTAAARTGTWCVRSTAITRNPVGACRSANASSSALSTSSHCAFSTTSSAPNGSARTSSAARPRATSRSTEAVIAPTSRATAPRSSAIPANGSEASATSGATRTTRSARSANARTTVDLPIPAGPCTTSLRTPSKSATATPRLISTSTSWGRAPAMASRRGVSPISAGEGPT